MNRLLKILIIFIFAALVTGVVSHYYGIELGDNNFWDHRGVFFLVFVAIFPRLTLLFSSVASGGILWWLCWLFVPRFLVAFLATVSYWQQNPILVGIAWFIAIGGESSEKLVFVKRGRNFQSYGDSPFARSNSFERPRPMKDVTPHYGSKIRSMITKLRRALEYE